MSIPSLLRILLDAQECPDCRILQGQWGDGDITYNVELCEKHALPAGYKLPCRAVLEMESPCRLKAQIGAFEYVEVGPVVEGIVLGARPAGKGDSNG